MYGKETHGPTIYSTVLDQAAEAWFIARSRFTVVTTAEAARVPVEDLVARYGMAGRARVRAANIAVLSLEDPNSGARDKLRSEIARRMALPSATRCLECQEAHERGRRAR